MHTCLETYYANKDANNAGWPQVDPEGRRLLQRLQRQAEELIRGNVI
jgi:hypothetical protein